MQYALEGQTQTTSRAGGTDLGYEVIDKFQFVLLNKIKFCQIIMPVYVKYALAFLWTILQECPCVDKN